MHLLLDIGNTRIKWALLTAHGLSVQQVLPHEGLSIAQIVSKVLEPCGAVDAVWVANVAGDSMAERICQAVHSHYRFQPLFMQANRSVNLCGRMLHNAYQHPEQLGVDRWLAMIAARAMFPDTVLVVSVGTAITVDAVDAQGQHLGGLIVPGLNLMTETLLRGTSDLAERAAQPINLEQSGSRYFADNTLAGIQLGSETAACGLIEASFRALQDSGGARLILTGGAALKLQPRLKVRGEFIADLVLQGMSCLAAIDLPVSGMISHSS